MTGSTLLFTLYEPFLEFMFLMIIHDNLFILITSTFKGNIYFIKHTKFNNLTSLVLKQSKKFGTNKPALYLLPNAVCM